MYQGMIWDMDGLIFDSEALYLEANLKAGQTMGISMTKSDYYEMIGASEAEAEAFNTSHFNSPAQQQEFYDLTETYVLKMVQAGQLKEKPGVRTLLAYLKTVQIDSVVASSNNQKMVMSFLDQFDLATQFSHIITREQVSASKPNPDLFLKAQAILGLEKSELLILEDSKNGIVAANRAGIDVVMIPDLIQPDANLKQQTVAVLPDLKKVIDFIKS